MYMEIFFTFPEQEDERFKYTVQWRTLQQPCLFVYYNLSPMYHNVVEVIFIIRSLSVIDL